MATLYMLTETSEFMMSFVVETEGGSLIVIDGGREEDMPLLKEYTRGRHIALWILTHPHSDHIAGLVSEMKKNGGADFDIGRICYHFPDYAAMKAVKEVPCRSYYEFDLNEMLPAFLEAEPLFRDKLYTVTQGEQLTVDEVTLDFLFTGRQGLYTNPINDYSLVFKLKTPKKASCSLATSARRAVTFCITNPATFCRRIWYRWRTTGT